MLPDPHNSPNFLLYMQIRFGMGLRMNQNYTHPAPWKTIDESYEIQSPPKQATARKERRSLSKPAPEKNQETEWENMTLDEMKS